MTKNIKLSKNCKDRLWKKAGKLWLKDKISAEDFDNLHKLFWAKNAKRRGIV